MRHDVEGHYLRHTTRVRMPQSILVFDTETKREHVDGEERHTMRLAVSCYIDREKGGRILRENWRVWKSRSAFMSYVQDLAVFKKELLIVGNNTFFDLQVSGFFTTLSRDGWQFDFGYDKGMTYILVISRDEATIRVVSLTNYLEASVKVLGEMLHLPKLDIDVFTDDLDLLTIYCHRDTEITLEAFLRYLAFIEDNDLGTFSLSRASQAMQAFRHRFMHSKLYHHMDETIMPLEEAGYFGGRTEAFRLGIIDGGPFIDLDINSMYPYVMRTFPMPTKCLDYFAQPSVQDLRDALKGYGAMADVTIDTDVPAFPFRHGPKVLFPVGRFRTVLCTAALRLALDRGYVKRVHRMSIYEMSYPFNLYVDFFYGTRLAAKRRGDDVTQRMAKLFMNSLYGKFAQRVPVETSNVEISFDGYSKSEIYDPETDTYDTVVRMFNREITYSGTEVARKSILAIPAHVTDYGRCMLWSIIEGIGSDRVLYCDTDSVKIRAEDITRVSHPMHDTDLGALKVEHKYDTLTMHGLKDYVAGDITRLKGIPRTAVMNPDGSYTYPQFLRQSSHMRRGVADAFIIRRVTKRLSREYTKGRVTSDGRVLPWCLPADHTTLEAL